MRPASALAPQAPTVTASADSTVTRYRLTSLLPLRSPRPLTLRYRGGATVTLEIIRDYTASVPTWVFRAKRPLQVSSHSHSPVIAPYPANTLGAPPLPTVNPLALAASLSMRDRCVILCSSPYGRGHLENALKHGFAVEAGSPAERIMGALVRMGYATATDSHNTPVSRSHSHNTATTACRSL